MTIKNNNTPELRFLEFKNDWEVKKFEKVFNIFNGYAFSSSDAIENGILWVKIADVGIQEMKKDSLSFLPKKYENTHQKFILKKGDYVVALTRPILNGKLKIAQVDDFFNNSLLNQRVGKIITHNCASFIYSLLQKDELIKAIENNIAGSDPPNLSPSEINFISVSIPTLPEQQKIANFLTAVDEKLSQLKKKKSLLEQYKKGVMQKIFTPSALGYIGLKDERMIEENEILSSSNPKNHNLDSLRFKDEDGKEFPEWEKKTLGEVAEVKRGAASQHLKYVNNENEGIRFLRINDFLSNDAVFVENTEEMKRYRVKTNDLLIAGTGATAGIIFIVPEKFNNLAYSYNVPRIRTISAYHTYIYYYLKSDIILKQQRQMFVGNAQHFLDTDAMRNFKIICPSLPEQIKIASFLSAIDEKINHCSKQIEKKENWKKGLLQKMFV